MNCKHKDDPRWQQKYADQNYPKYVLDPAEKAQEVKELVEKIHKLQEQLARIKEKQEGL